jgi:hypothetical protein
VHVSAHAPIAHNCPGGHVVPHAPQFDTSFATSMHRSVQNICPVAHVAAHIPVVHT